MDMPSEGAADLIQQLTASQSSLKDLVKQPLACLQVRVYFYVCVATFSLFFFRCCVRTHAG